MDYQTIIGNNLPYFITSNIFIDAARVLGWWLIKALASLSELCEIVFNEAYNTLNFTGSQAYKTFVSSFSVLIIAGMTLTFAVLGTYLMFSEKKPPVIKNIMILLAVVYLTPTVITSLNEGLLSAKNELMSDSYSTATVLSNISDLKTIANRNWDFNVTLADTVGAETKDVLSAIDSSEHLKASEFDTDLQKQVFNHYRLISDSGTLQWYEIGTKGLFDILDPPYYYRYKIHYIQLIIVLLANIFVFLFSGYAVIKMIWEIATTRIIGTLASLDLTSGQKTIKTIEAFFDGYIVLFGIPVILKLYLLWQQYLNTSVSNQFVRPFLILFGALVVIDGPAAIQRLFGYDMGISAGSQKMMSFLRMVQQARMQHHFSSQARNARKTANAHKSDSTARQSAVQRANASNSSTSESGGAMQEPNVGTDNTTPAPMQEPNTTGNSSHGMAETPESGTPSEGMGFESSNMQNTESTYAGEQMQPTEPGHNAAPANPEAGSGSVPNINPGSGAPTGEQKPTEPGHNAALENPEAGSGSVPNINPGSGAPTGEQKPTEPGHNAALENPEAGSGSVPNINPGSGAPTGEQKPTEPGHNAALENPEAGSGSVPNINPGNGVPTGEQKPTEPGHNAAPANPEAGSGSVPNINPGSGAPTGEQKPTEPGHNAALENPEAGSGSVPNINPGSGAPTGEQKPTEPGHNAALENPEAGSGSVPNINPGSGAPTGEQKPTEPGHNAALENPEAGSGSVPNINPGNGVPTGQHPVEAAVAPTQGEMMSKRKFNINPFNNETNERNDK